MTISTFGVSTRAMGVAFFVGVAALLFISVPTPASAAINPGRVTITVDDGWKDSFESIMDANVFGAYKTTQYIYSDAMKQVHGPSYMDDTEVKQMFDAGHEIGGHTVHHTDLASTTAPLSAAQLKAEIEDNRNDLIAAGIPSPSSFAYPYGSYTATVANAVHDAGYSNARTVDEGFNTSTSSPYLFKIQHVTGATTATQLKNWIKQATTTNTWLILMFHEIVPNVATDCVGEPTDGEDPEVSECTSRATVASMVTYLSQNYVCVQTMSQVMAGTSCNVAPVLASIGSKSVAASSTLTFTAHATDGNNDTITYGFLAGTAIGGATINSSTGAFSWKPTLLQIGATTTTITVNDGHGGTDSETITITVGKANQTITFAALGAKMLGDADFTVTATASLNLPVSFTASGTCSVNVATVHLVSEGDCTITAQQAGDTNYNAASNVARTFHISPFPPATLTVVVPLTPSGAGASVAIDTGTSTPYSGPVTFSVGQHAVVTASSVAGFTASLVGDCDKIAAPSGVYTCTVSYTAIPVGGGTSSSGGSSGGGGGGGGSAYRVKINNGDAQTNSANVTISLSRGATSATKVWFSNNSAFATGTWEAYSNTKSWTLTSGAGSKTVYVRFGNANNSTLTTQDDSITLNVGQVLGASTVNPSAGGQASGLSEAQIKSILDLLRSFGAEQKVIDSVNASLHGTGGSVKGASTFKFTLTLMMGSSGNEVTELQKRLQSEGVYSGPVTGYFGALTKAGVAAYQTKNGLPAVGVVGPLTRAKLNS